jgi:hypothetical protein
MGTDAFTILAAASQVRQRLRLGTGIVPITPLTPTPLVMTIMRLIQGPRRYARYRRSQRRRLLSCKIEGVLS